MTKTDVDTFSTMVFPYLILAFGPLLLTAFGVSAATSEAVIGYSFSVLLYIGIALVPVMLYLTVKFPKFTALIVLKQGEKFYEPKLLAVIALAGTFLVGFATDSEWLTELAGINSVLCLLVPGLLGEVAKYEIAKYNMKA